jgi:lipopolysaccharide transport system ATP-binding protein
MTVVVRVENVSKKYQLGSIGTQSLKGDFNRWWARMRGKEDPFSKIGEESQHHDGDFWALKDINFEVKQGEAVGIIGKNGAGKSTLLKILSRITNPTTGNVKIRGRIASLLEVGTGFNPDLTGRDNIYLNGAILGMTKREIAAKFDEIVDFSGIERFIDTPVKRYSSGMYVRLAFAVAAHLESEILILDEVLAVGDAEFQKKCLGKMDDVAHKQGRTILFVSHNMGAIKSLCNTGLFLKKGSVAFFDNNIQDLINKYIETDKSSATDINISQRTDRQGNGSLRIEAFDLMNSIDNSQIELGKQIGFRLIYHTSLESFRGKILISINNFNGECILFIDSTTINNFPLKLQKSGEVVVKLSEDFGLPQGRYFVNIAFLVNDVMADYIQSALLFNVVDGLFYEGGKIPIGKSLCYVKQEWNYQINSY